MAYEITCDVIHHFDVFTGVPVTACTPPHTGTKLLKIGPWTSCVTLRRHVTGRRPFGCSRPPPIDLLWRLDVKILFFLYLFSSFGYYNVPHDVDWRRQRYHLGIFFSCLCVVQGLSATVFC